MSDIQLDTLTKTFGDVTAVNDVSYTISDGEFFVIVGPSGCGKSTTLRMIAGFEEPTSGAVSLEAGPIDHLPPEDRDIRMVFQDYALFPHMTVAENLEFGLKMNDVDPDTHREKVESVLNLVGLPETEGKYPDSLSGGQQQRVALARALVLEPDVLLLDEPLSNLDKNLRDQMQVELKRIQRETGVTAIHVTHNQAEALSLADKVCVMNDGTVEQIGSPEEVYYRPTNQFVADFLGDSNTFGTAERRDHPSGVELRIAGSDVELVVADTPPASDGTTVFFRPEHVTVATQSPAELPAENVFSATVESRLFSGDKVKYRLSVDAGEHADSVDLTAFSHTRLDVGDTVEIHIPPEDVRLL